MLFSILKDSFILFLLIYALLSLAEKLSKGLEHLFEKPQTKLLAYQIIDIRDIPAERLEIPLKNALKASEKHILLLTGSMSTEVEHIVLSLIQGANNIQIANSDQLEKIMHSPEGATAFFTRDDDHSCHNSRSISS